MSSVYVADQISRGSLCYGLASFHAGNGKFVRHLTSVLGNGLQVRAQLALGVGRYNGLRKLAYSGIDIPAQYYRFHNDGANPSDDYFPLDVPHLNWSWVNFEIPGAMGNENDLSKIVGIAECRKVADYDSNGNQTGLGWSQNAARIAVDGVKLFTGSPLHVDFGSYLEYKAFCDELITVNINGSSVQQERFKINLVFLLQQSITLEQFLNRVCELTCSDWQWSRGKIRFLPPTNANQQPKFNFDLSKVAQEFKFQAHTFKSRFNGVEVAWRDENDELLREQQPIIVDRRANNNVPKRFYTFDYGVGRKHQVERFGHATARLRCDLADYAFVRGSWKSYHVLPGDVVTLSHPTADWTSKRCKVIKKTENEETGIGYNYSLQVQPSEPYSDTDTSPLVTRTPVIGANPYTPPPAPTFTLTPDSALGADGANYNFIKGVVTFGAYNLKQRAKVYWMKPGGSYQELDTLEPLGNQATFQAPNPPSGDNWFKVVAYSELGAKIDPPLNDQKITIDPEVFYVEGFPVPPGLFRALTSTAPNGSYTGRDSAVVPREVIKPWIDSAAVVNDTMQVVLAVKFASLGIDSEGKPVHNQTDSVSDAVVEVFNSLGAKIKNFPPSGFNRSGGTVATSFPRSFLDVYEGQAVFKVSIVNSRGTSLPVYLRYNRWSDMPNAAAPTYTITNNKPTPVAPEIGTEIETPRNLVVTALDFQTLQIRYINYTYVNIYYREFGTKAWQLHSVQWNGATAINKFPAEKRLEIQLRDYETGDRSEIVTVQLPPQPAAPPERPVPTISVNVDPANATSKILYSVQKNTANNTGIEYKIVETNQIVSKAANETTGEITGLGEGVTRTVQARNVFSGGATSEWSAPASATTNITPPVMIAAPSISAGYYDAANVYSVIQFAANAGAGGTFILQYREGSSGNFVNVATDIPASETFAFHSLLQSRYTRYCEYRIGRTSGQGGWSQPFGIEVPMKDDYVKPPGYDPYDPFIPLS